MSVADMLSSWACCLRADGSKYIQPCGCPQAALITKSTQTTATLCGLSEYVDPSTPPRKFKTESWRIVNSRETWACCLISPGPTPTVVQSRAVSVDDTSVRKVTDLSLCAVGNVGANPVMSGTKWNCAGSPSPVTEALNFCSGSVSETITPTSKTTSTSSTTESTGSACGTFQSSACAYSITQTLTDEDTEPDALDRAIAAVSAADTTTKTSIWETRSTGFSLTKRTVDYCLLLTNLVPGKDYEGSIPKQSREAVIGTTDIWEDEDADTYAFTAAAPYHIEGGSLNPAITPEQFIAAGYDIVPVTYGLTTGEDVVIPATPIDHTQGFEFQVGTNASGDAITIEVAAP